MSSNSCVIVLKTKSGEDVLGFYTGEIDTDEDDADGMVLYRPIKIKPVTQMRNGRISYNYATEFYFPYGEPLVPILYSNIVTSDIANWFFSRMYEKVLCELLSFEDDAHADLIKLFDKDDLDSAMEGTDSMYFDQECEYKQ